MVTKLKDNLSYIKYIRNKMQESLPDFQEVGASYEGQINNNFQINFEFLDNKVSFVKDRGMLELRMSDNEGPARVGYLLYNSIFDFVPDQDPNWIVTLCTELIDCYVHFLKSYFIKR